MAGKPLPSRSLLEQLLRYETETGLLFWLERDVSMFEDGEWNPAHRKASMWNAKNAGKEALGYIGAYGYKAGGLLGVSYVTHRVIWKLVTGEEPDFIDHINGSRSDNRWSNLRSVTKRENARNQKLRQNVSGICGVSWHKGVGKWCARIRDDEREVHLGFFDDISLAAETRRAAEVRLGYHENHGKARQAQ